MVPLSTRMSARGVLLIWATVVSAHASRRHGVYGSRGVREVPRGGPRQMVAIQAQQDGAAGDQHERERGLDRAGSCNCAAHRRPCASATEFSISTKSTLTGKPQEHQ